MSPKVDLQGTLNHFPDALQPSASPEVADHLRDVQIVKWWTRLIVYPGVTLLIPLDHLLFGLTWQQALSVHLGGFVIATVAIELAFYQGLKLKKRSAYPGDLSLRLGGMPTFDAASQAATAILDGLLHLEGSFLALQSDSGYLSLVALSKVGRVEADRYLRLGAASVQRALARKQPVVLRTDNDPHDLLSEAIVAPGQQIVFVPVQSFQKVVGIAGLLADESNSDMRDSELLVSLGSALGVALESVRYRDELRILAAVDELTNVYNRRYFFDQLGREISAARRYSLPASVLVLDLDGLKRLNDTFGHGLGDEALRTVAQRLVRFSRASDIVARLGGDEFAVILPQTDGAGALDIGQRLKTSVERDGLAAVPGREIRISVSCGWASFPEDADDIDALLRQADGRMYAAKAARSRKRQK